MLAEPSWSQLVKTVFMEWKYGKSPSRGKVVLIVTNAFHRKSTVSSTDFRHKVAAPTLPPVTGRTAYRREEASSIDASVALGVEPFS